MEQHTDSTGAVTHPPGDRIHNNGQLSNSDETDIFQPPTIEDHRKAIRRLLGDRQNDGEAPLRRDERHRAYWHLTGEIHQYASSGEIAWKTLNTLSEDFDADLTHRDPWNLGTSYRKDELAALREALDQTTDQSNE